MNASVTDIQNHLDALLPFRTLALPGPGEPCGSCGHLPGCARECCAA